MRVSDVGTLDTFTVIISWGNGSQTFNNVPAGNFSYTHQYLDDNATDTYPISIDVGFDDGFFHAIEREIEIWKDRDIDVGVDDELRVRCGGCTIEDVFDERQLSGNRKSVHVQH